MYVVKSEHVEDREIHQSEKGREPEEEYSKVCHGHDLGKALQAPYRRQEGVQLSPQAYLH